MAVPAMVALAVLFGGEPVSADLVLHHGKIWTVNAKQPEAEAVAVWHGRVLRVGTNAEIMPLVGANSRSIDLQGQRVVPGFHDSHAHFLGGGQQLGWVELKDAKDEAEFGRRLREVMFTTPRLTR